MFVFFLNRSPGVSRDVFTESNEPIPISTIWVLLTPLDEHHSGLEPAAVSAPREPGRFAIQFGGHMLFV